ncbi:MAG TPA: Hpt domain-containing protein [Vicinamibacterales bacterium]|nr:Hpt domain-containing protein [Vicinamibacterales bacterium]
MERITALDASVLDNLRQLTSPGEPDVLTEVLKLFLAEVPRRMDVLRNAHGGGNIEEVYRSAHSLKGSAGNVGAHALAEVCRLIEERGKSGDAAALPALVDALDVEYRKVETEIHRLIGV